MKLLISQEKEPIGRKCEQWASFLYTRNRLSNALENPFLEGYGLFLWVPSSSSRLKRRERGDCLRRQRCYAVYSLAGLCSDATCLSAAGQPSDHQAPAAYNFLASIFVNSMYHDDVSTVCKILQFIFELINLSSMYSLRVPSPSNAIQNVLTLVLRAGYDGKGALKLDLRPLRCKLV